MVFHKKYFWFFFRWKEFVCETELKTLFQNLFSLSCVKSNWNQVKVSFSMCENKKNFFSAEKLFFFFYEWKLIFHEQDQQNVCISTCETPNPKQLYFKENIFFFPAKKIFVQQKKFVMCETEIKPFFQQWNQGRVCFGHVKQKKTFFQEKNVLFFLMCYNFFSMCETKRNYVFPLVKAKIFFFFFFTSVKQS